MNECWCYVGVMLLCCYDGVMLVLCCVVLCYDKVPNPDSPAEVVDMPPMKLNYAMHSHTVSEYDK